MYQIIKSFNAQRRTTGKTLIAVQARAPLRLSVRDVGRCRAGGVLCLSLSPHLPLPVPLRLPLLLPFSVPLPAPLPLRLPLPVPAPPPLSPGVTSAPLALSVAVACT